MKEITTAKYKLRARAAIINVKRSTEGQRELILNEFYDIVWSTYTCDAYRPSHISYFAFAIVGPLSITAEIATCMSTSDSSTHRMNVQSMLRAALCHCIHGICRAFINAFWCRANVSHARAAAQHPALEWLHLSPVRPIPSVDVTWSLAH